MKCIRLSLSLDFIILWGHHFSLPCAEPINFHREKLNLNDLYIFYVIFASLRRAGEEERPRDCFVKPWEFLSGTVAAGSLVEIYHVTDELCA